jgi:hypothetical protein
MAAKWQSVTANTAMLCLRLQMSIIAIARFFLVFSKAYGAKLRLARLLIQSQHQLHDQGSL